MLRVSDEVARLSACFLSCRGFDSLGRGVTGLGGAGGGPAVLSKKYLGIQKKIPAGKQGSWRLQIQATSRLCCWVSDMVPSEAESVSRT